MAEQSSNKTTLNRANVETGWDPLSSLTSQSTPHQMSSTSSHHVKSNTTIVGENTKPEHSSHSHSHSQSHAHRRSTSPLEVGRRSQDVGAKSTPVAGIVPALQAAAPTRLDPAAVLATVLPPAKDRHSGVRKPYQVASSAIVAPIVEKEVGAASTAMRTIDGLSADDTLAGERMVMKIDTVYQSASGLSVPGTMIMTNYKVVFKPSDSRLIIDRYTAPDFFYLPLSAIARVEKGGSQRNLALFVVELHSKDNRLLKFGFNPNDHAQKKVIDVLTNYVFPFKIEYVFAFYHTQAVSPSMDGWNLYDAVTEFERLGVSADSRNNGLFRVTRLNQTYQLCSTYPQVLAVPTAITDDDLWKIAAFRSKGRLPVLSWIHPRNGASLWRSSQPKTGMRQMRSDEDEKMLRLIGACNRNSSTVSIIDCRPQLNAYVNKAAGAGYESMDHYDSCRIVFMNIQNIHVVRDSHKKLCSMAHHSNIMENNHWFSHLESSHWLEHIANLLSSSVIMVEALELERVSILCHCSDGWDRTAQLVSTVELLMDPFFRTIKGFQLLIEKEWLSYGHRFSLRNGHGDKNHADDQRAPIFVQWMDCVYQIIRQFPSAFEFTDKLLLAILDHLYSCRFGTFLFNCDQERVAVQLKERTVSLWTYLNAEPRQFVNVFYTPYIEKPLLPAVSLRRMCVWEEYHMKWHSCMFNMPLDPTRGRAKTEDLYKAALARIEALEAELTASGKPIPPSSLLNPLQSNSILSMQNQRVFSSSSSSSSDGLVAVAPARTSAPFSDLPSAPMLARSPVAAASSSSSSRRSVSPANVLSAGQHSRPTSLPSNGSRSPDELNPRWSAPSQRVSSTSTPASAASSAPVSAETKRMMSNLFGEEMDDMSTPSSASIPPPFISQPAPTASGPSAARESIQEPIVDELDEATSATNRQVVELPEDAATAAEDEVEKLESQIYFEKEQLEEQEREAIIAEDINRATSTSIYDSLGQSERLESIDYDEY
eukprot:GILJ01006845.1.p1 GENE.GILJ01006845.1~~GILJ01006845.1.p1  ORF type:complete len:991 (-),score=153.71 GILJ01006845.1:214-3186(-)